MNNLSTKFSYTGFIINKCAFDEILQNFMEYINKNK